MFELQQCEAFSPEKNHELECAQTIKRVSFHHKDFRGRKCIGTGEEGFIPSFTCCLVLEVVLCRVTRGWQQMKMS